MDAVDALRIPEVAGLIPVFDNHAGSGKFSRMSNRECCAGKTQAGCNMGGAPVEPKAGPPAWFADDLDLQPAYPVAYAGSQGLGAGLLGSKPGGKALRGVALAQAIGLFCFRKNTVEKAPSITINGGLDAPNLHHIDPRANDHPDYQT